MAPKSLDQRLLFMERVIIMQWRASTVALQGISVSYQYSQILSRNTAITGMLSPLKLRVHKTDGIKRLHYEQNRLKSLPFLENYLA